MPRFERFELVATFEVGAELDYGLVLVGYETVLARGLDTRRASWGALRARRPDGARCSGACDSRPQLPAGWQLDGLDRELRRALSRGQAREIA